MTTAIIIGLLAVAVLFDIVLVLLLLRKTEQTDTSRIEKLLKQSAGESSENMDKKIIALQDATSKQLSDLRSEQSRALGDMSERMAAAVQGVKEAVQASSAEAEKGRAMDHSDLKSLLDGKFSEINQAQAKSSTELSEKIGTDLRTGREEQGRLFDSFEQRLDKSLSGMQRTVAGSTDAVVGLKESVTTSLSDIRTASQDGVRMTEKAVSEGFQQTQEKIDGRLDMLQQTMAKILGGIVTEVRGRLDKIQSGNEAQLEKIRETVDEKLQRTLNDRLTASFGAVSEQLQAVSRGLGEMQGLASDTKALKNALTNVKSRGTYGEVRCEKLLQDILAPSQYEKNVNIQGNNIVEFAVKLPGTGIEPVYLPIDSKFPVEDYNRLLDAEDRASIEVARRGLRTKILAFAKDIHDKYILPPKTTDFAVMFLPTEGLYAEVIQDAALFEELRTRYGVTPVGVATLSAFLSSLQVGFRTLAIEQRAQDVQESLKAVKSEMGKFADLLQKAQKQVQQADATLGELSGRRLNAISRKLRSFDTLPEAEATSILGLPPLERGSE